METLSCRVFWLVLFCPTYSYPHPNETVLPGVEFYPHSLSPLMVTKPCLFSGYQPEDCHVWDTRKGGTHCWSAFCHGVEVQTSSNPGISHAFIPQMFIDIQA